MVAAVALLVVSVVLFAQLLVVLFVRLRLVAAVVIVVVLLVRADLVALVVFEQFEILAVMCFVVELVVRIVYSAARSVYSIEAHIRPLYSPTLPYTFWKHIAMIFCGLFASSSRNGPANSLRIINLLKVSIIAKN